MSDCACIVSDYDGDLPEFFKARKVKSRKNHVCCECHEDINYGEIYEYACGKWSGSFDVFKTCLNCFSVRDTFFCSGGSIFGNMWEELREYLEPGECLDKLMLKITQKAREKILEIIDIDDQ